MGAIVILVCCLTTLAMILLVPDHSASALLLITPLSVLTALLIKRNSDDAVFLTRVFLLGLCLRLLLGIFIESSGLLKFFGGDSLQYDEMGSAIVRYWYGIGDPDHPLTVTAISTRGAGWGMNYLVAIIYLIYGQSMFIAQTFCSVVGAATAPMIYWCAKMVYGNRRVARLSALFIAFFPTYIIWSGQLLKDGPMVFLLAVAVAMVMLLQRRLSLIPVACLIFALFGILSIRFYIFYMIAAAAVGALIIGTRLSIISVVRGGLATCVLGLILTYMGVTQTAAVNLEDHSYEKLEAGRQFAAKEANSGYGRENDLSTVDGVLTALPVGLAYLILAPFPWQIQNFRQAITMPEMMIWWCLLPFLVKGIRYTIKHRLFDSASMLLFSFMLTIAYALFQNNIGTAYRHRTQIQIFLFIFIAVGWVLEKERREDNAIKRRIYHRVVAKLKL